MIQNHVTNQELSQALYDAGIVLDTCFYWCNDPTKNKKWIITEIDNKTSFKAEWVTYIPAPMSSELGEMLRPYLDRAIWLDDITPALKDATYMIDEANARAKMLLFLVKEGIVTVEKEI